jgi:CheY-like chemotaxis protein
MADTLHNRPVALIVEDNQVNRMVASQMLSRGGVSTIDADGGPSAIGTLQTTSVDVVLMDVQMPGMDGLETARAIRRGDAGDANREVPIVAMTAFATQQDEDDCYAAGMDYYLSKPLNMQRFLDTVHEAIRRSRAPSTPAE